MESSAKLLKRFSVGAAIGLVIVLINWVGYVSFFGYSLPFATGLILCFSISIICGLMTIKWGYQIIENLLQLLM
ncbi:hypothetical protein FD725_18895 [Nostoc sp. TCL26-01]|nr:hypothetical protein FD725_18895 [Nostoc sp. TCL26-01]